MVKIAPNLKWVGIAILALEGVFPSHAMAQPLEDIRVQELADKIVVSINLSGPVHYLRNSPSGKRRRGNSRPADQPAETSDCRRGNVRRANNPYQSEPCFGDDGSGDGP
jgi:hypothetical protein